jgi:hypothetical protein
MRLMALFDSERPNPDELVSVMIVTPVPSLAMPIAVMVVMPVIVIPVVILMILVG